MARPEATGSNTVRAGPAVTVTGAAEASASSLSRVERASSGLIPEMLTPPTVVPRGTRSLVVRMSAR